MEMTQRILILVGILTQFFVFRYSSVISARPFSWKAFGKALLFDGIIGCILAGVILAGWMIWPHFNNWLLRKGLEEVQILTAILAFACGCMAYFFRKASQWFYGFCEVVFGTLYAGKASAGLTLAKPDFTVQWAIIMAAVYIIVRGISNMAEASARRKALVEESERRRAVFSAATERLNPSGAP